MPRRGVATETSPCLSASTEAIWPTMKIMPAMRGRVSGMAPSGIGSAKSKGRASTHVATFERKLMNQGLTPASNTFLKMTAEKA